MSGRKLSARKQQKITLQYKMGASLRDIAQECKIGVSVVQRVLRREGIKPLPGNTRLTNLEKQGLLLRYQSGEEIMGLARDYDISSTHVYRILRESGVRARGYREGSEKRLTLEQRAEICRRYLAGEGAPQLACEFGIDRNNVNALLRRRRISRRTPSEARITCALNEEAFDDLTEEVRYWLGFFMCDGHIRPSKSGQTEIVLDLAEKDREHVEKFRRFLGSTHTISDRTDSNGHKHCTLVVRSDRMANYLGRFGIVHRKNRDGTGELPRSLAFDRHVWRGCIDANGTVRITKRGYAFIQMAGWRRIVEQFVEYTRTIVPEYTGTVWDKQKVSAVAHTSASYAERIIDRLYANCSVALDRKLEAARRILGSLSARGDS